ncbi:hypothetical protein [Roseateles violae]|uniref:DUF308 domain-containing protein n=1 Tax=Roseateles violae TaxID=3058042 RepID=A0ABT8DTM9_9BURK|nr:hypothetical protein [Pelomonas sp. PFR6]MDN3919531.1 hypothetical protein [Pelomonas sp. PFR6]
MKHREQMLRVGGHHQRRWRIAVWGLAAALLALPGLAMQFSSEVRWGVFDFIVFALMLLCACGGYELAQQLRPGNGSQRAAVCVAIAGGFLLVWMNLAVGLIGEPDDPANLMFAGVLLIGLLGAALTRLRPGAMAGVLLAMAAAQALAAGVAALAGWRLPPLASLFFIALWLLSAQLFRRAAARAAV